uniref:Uncharacterized protein n=1 Tax=Zooxanthella nutricula TaxID=1333877 RepID=A0A7S2HBK5_9DINO
MGQTSCTAVRGCLKDTVCVEQQAERDLDAASPTPLRGDPDDVDDGRGRAKGPKRGVRPFAVPPHVAAAVAIGGPLGPPLPTSSGKTSDADAAKCGSASGAAGTVTEKAGTSGACSASSTRTPLACCTVSRDGLAVVALQAFKAAMKDGVGLSLLFHGVGVLLVEAHLALAGEPGLVLHFNQVRRLVHLATVDSIVVERAHQDTGAWLMRIVVCGEGAWTFLFDGTADGQKEAYYLRGCLPQLAEDAKAAAVMKPMRLQEPHVVSFQKHAARVLRKGDAAPGPFGTVMNKSRELLAPSPSATSEWRSLDPDVMATHEEMLFPAWEYKV